MIQITDSMLYNTINNELLDKSTQVYKLQGEISSGLRINYPQDDPAGIVNVLSYKHSVALVKQYSSNVNLANEVASLASSTLNSTINVTNNASTLAIEMANGSVSTINNSAAAQGVTQMINELLQSANTSYNGQNVFTGDNIAQASAYTETQASYNVVSPNGASTTVKYTVYTYSGTDVNRKYQIAKNGFVAPSPTADNIFGNDSASASSTNIQKPTGLISVLSLFKSELSAGVYQSDSSNIIGEIKKGLSRILSAQSTIGTVMQRLNAQSTSYQTVLSNISQLLGQTQNVNIAKAMMHLTQTQNSYQATLEAAAGITRLTPILLKYL